MKKDLTTGSVFKNIILFSIPYLFSYLLQSLYGMADLFIIGQFDKIASTTAVSIGSQVMHMLTVTIVGLAMGTTVSIGQAVGSNDQKKASKIIGNTCILFLVLSFIVMGLLLLVIHPIVNIMSTPKEAIYGTTNYLLISFIGIPFITIYNIISSIFRGMGDSKKPMYFIAIACFINIILDYIFIGIFHLGTAGAALGTTLSQGTSAIISIIFILKKKEISLSKKDFDLSKSIISKIISIGFPIALQDCLLQVAFIVITIIVNQRGLNDAAAVGIVEKIMSFLLLIPSSVSSSVSAIASQNIGANKPERAIATLRYAIFIATGFGLISTVMVQFCAESLVSLFTNSSNINVITLGGQYLRGYIFDSMLAGIHFSFSGYFCANGKSGLSFLHNIIAIILIRIPGAYVTAKQFPNTLFPMGLATAAGSLLSIIICIVAFIIMQRKASPKLLNYKEQ